MKNIDSLTRVDEFFARPLNGDAGAIPTSELLAELDLREKENVFPLEVFHPLAKELLTYIHTKGDLPRSFLGLSMLCAYSTAIGTAFAIEGGSGPMYLAMWACLEGMTSSGKSQAYKLMFRPINEIQKEFDKEWEEAEKAAGCGGPSLNESRMKHIVYRDANIPILVRDIMPDNPKGLLRESDEFLEWLNAMNSLARPGKEGADEQFWLSGWNGTGFSAVRSGRSKYSIPRVFINVVGGIPAGITYKLFKNDRDVTGFVFRILFAILSKQEISLPDADFHVPHDYMELHRKVIRSLYFGLPVTHGRDEPRMLSMNSEASKVWDSWRRMKAMRIKSMTNESDKNIHAGILGKMNEYALRFAGLLHVSDLAYENRAFPHHDSITASTMERAIKLAEYFYQSAWDVHCRVNQSVTAPIEVLRYASYVRAAYSYQQMGDKEFGTTGKPDARRKKAERLCKAYLKAYPKAFAALMK